MPKDIFAEMMHFFEVYKNLEHKDTAVKEISQRENAVEIIEKCLLAYNNTFVK
jgi:inorganic pyrophosphatase